MSRTLGEAIGAARRKAGLTVEALAKKIDVTKQAVSSWETDVSVPRSDHLPGLARALGVTVGELFGEQRK